MGGQWLTPSSKEKLSIINPATEEVIATVPACSRFDAERAIKAAHEAFPTWSQSSPLKRKEVLLRIAEIMEENLEDLATAISESMGCPLGISRWLQVQDSIEVIRSFAEHTFLTEEVNQLGNSNVIKEPIGVCAFINPWNFPLYQLVAKVGAALAAGCTMVVKPSEQTPLQDFIFAEILSDAGVPDGVFNVVTGTGMEVGATLSSHPLVDLVSFTGSTNAGIQIAKSAADTVKRVTQELGGKSPFIITPDADIELAVKYGIDDIMLNTGQTCTALTRMLVHESCHDKAKELAKKFASEKVIGGNDTADIGPLSSLDHWLKIQKYIEIGIEQGAELICGGTGKPEGIEKGYYVRPTIFANVSNHMRIAREEIFGPVLCIIPYKNLDHAIEIANDTDFGLNSAVYSKDESSALKLARRIRAGLCYINGAELNLQAPFGGYKRSGNGRELSKMGVEEFFETKSIQLPKKSK